jgi:hypothetical protein
MKNKLLKNIGPVGNRCAIPLCIQKKEITRNQMKNKLSMYMYINNRKIYFYTLGPLVWKW